MKTLEKIAEFFKTRLLEESGIDEKTRKERESNNVIYWIMTK